MIVSVQEDLSIRSWQDGSECVNYRNRGARCDWREGPSAELLLRWRERGVIDEAIGARGQICPTAFQPRPIAIGR